MGKYIKITSGETVTIELPGLTAIKIDAANRTIAIDGISGHVDEGPMGWEWPVQDLRDGIYGDFHRLAPSADCHDAACAESGQHVGESEGRDHAL